MTTFFKFTSKANPFKVYYRKKAFNMSQLYNSNTLMDLPLTTFSLDILIKTLNHLTFCTNVINLIKNPQNLLIKLFLKGSEKHFSLTLRKKKRKIINLLSILKRKIYSKKSFGVDTLCFGLIFTKRSILL